MRSSRPDVPGGRITALRSSGGLGAMFGRIFQGVVVQRSMGVQALGMRQPGFHLFRALVFRCTHAAPGHQFRHQPIPGPGGSKNDFVPGRFFNDLPSGYHPLTILLADHRRIAGSMQTVTRMVAVLETSLGAFPGWGLTWGPCQR